MGKNSVLTFLREYLKTAEKVEIDGTSLLVYSGRKGHINFVRYAWGDFPASTLYNGDGFPASPFCSEVNQ